jgi:hypothetical protein
VSAAHALPRDKQLEIVRRLLNSLVGGSTGPETDGSSFWALRTIEELARERGTPIIADVRRLALPDWPADESADDLIDYLREQRHADRGA